jgi:hypothetical protein
MNIELWWKVNSASQDGCRGFKAREMFLDKVMLISIFRLKLWVDSKKTGNRERVHDSM